MKIEAIHIRNYKVFQNVRLVHLPKMCVFVGANGSGKSTLFDVFGFLRDSLTHNVRQALARRGGFKEVISRGETGPITFEIKFREGKGPLVTYFVAIGLKDGIPIVEKELLKYRRGQTGKPWHFLDFSEGRGLAITNESDYGSPDAEMKRDEQELDSPDILAIKGLGQFQRFRMVSAFRRLIEQWHVSDFHISDARPSQDSGHAEHLSSRGDNLALVTQYIWENYPDVFQSILDKMSQRVPGIQRVEAIETEDGRIVLKFQDGSFKDPFLARYVSDGTIKMFAYLVLLYDPNPHPLLCIEEPENQLYPSLLDELVEEFRGYAVTGGQVFISTHSPDFLNSVELKELFWLVKKEGFTQIHRAEELTLIHHLLEEGDSLGGLWKQGLFDGVHPV